MSIEVSSGLTPPCGDSTASGTTTRYFMIVGIIRVVLFSAAYFFSVSSKLFVCVLAIRWNWSLVEIYHNKLKTHRLEMFHSYLNDSHSFLICSLQNFN